MSWEIEPITDSDNNSLYCLVNSGDLRAFSLNNIATITFSTFEEADMLRGKLESYEPFYTLPLQSLKTLLIALAKISEERWENTVRLVLPDSNHFSAASIINFKLEWKRSGTFHADKEKCLHYSSPLRAKRVSGYIGEAAAIANAFNELVTITLPDMSQEDIQSFEIDAVYEQLTQLLKLTHNTTHAARVITLAGDILSSMSEAATRN